MARFVAWWTNGARATPTDIAAVATAAGMKAVMGDHVVDTFDFGDGGPPAQVLSVGTVVSLPDGSEWLVRPGAGAHEGWLAQSAARQGDRGMRATVRKVGTALSTAESILDGLMCELQRSATTSTAA